MAAKVSWKCLYQRNFMLNSLWIWSSRNVLISGNVFRCLSSLTKVALSSEEKADHITSTDKDFLQTPDYKTTVHPDITEILERSRPQLVGNNWHKPKLSARKVAELRKKYMAQGFYWPERPLVDRGMDKTPKGHKYEREKQEKLAKIEENMKNMPKIIEEYRKKMKELRTKRKEDKKISSHKALEAKRAGIHPKDPRAQAALGQDSKKSKAKLKKKEKSS